jgi:hypothetical protein
VSPVVVAEEWRGRGLAEAVKPASVVDLMREEAECFRTTIAAPSRRLFFTRSQREASSGDESAARRSTSKITSVRAPISEQTAA